MYRLHVQLTPQISEEQQMRYFWHIDLHTKEGNFTVHHGFGNSPTECALDAITCAGLNGIAV